MIYPSPSLFEKTLELATAASNRNEVPVAALVCEWDTDKSKWDIIGSGQNRIKEFKDATAHAEIRAISAACQVRKSERLPRSILISTLEPCPMCTGAAILARVDAIYYFAPLESGLGIHDILKIENTRNKALNHRPEVHHVTEYQARAAQLLIEFFQSKRKVIEKLQSTIPEKP